MPSLSFLGDYTSYLRIPNTTEMNFGTGDFTIEWYQYQTDSNPFPRIFQIGSYGEGDTSGTSIGVSIEGGSFYFWSSSSPNFVTSLDSSVYKNQWVHFAISRASGTTRIFMNGTSIFDMADETDYSSINDLIIGNETKVINVNPSNQQSVDDSNISAFGGYLSYFSWVKGVALYTSNFTVPTDFPIVTSDYQLLLTESSFTGTLGNTALNNNVSNTTNVPPGFPGSPPPPPPPIPPFTPPTNMKKSLFANNAMVFYARGSLAPGGVGGVGNASIKARKT
jgi:hypothetical protein